MPGVLQVESLSQMLVVAITTLPENKGKATRIISVSSNFRKEVLPGDKLVIDIKVNSWKHGVVKGVGIGYTNGTIAVEAEMVISMPDILKQYLPKKEDK
jgi:3-hydroxyacyl-[acyl-carrier-protein] dehydratase